MIEKELNEIEAAPKVDPNQPTGEPNPEKGSQPAKLSWPQFIQQSESEAVQERLVAELAEIINGAAFLNDYHVLGLLQQPRHSIGGYELDQIYSALSDQEKARENVLLLLVSGGGQIEPAYQIAKLCKSYAKKGKFVVAVPREAKSAATLISIGANEIHMGPLGHLGPIDPQVDGLPALGVSAALQSIAALVQEFPGSATMFSQYLKMKLTVEQIGYYDRVSKSAAQYAERLLKNKSQFGLNGPEVANELVYEYKDHGFVIDFDEAQLHLGKDWIFTDTEVTQLAEKVYRKFFLVNLFLQIIKNKDAIIIGDLRESSVFISSTEKSKH